MPQDDLACYAHLHEPGSPDWRVKRTGLFCNAAKFEQEK